MTIKFSKDSVEATLIKDARGRKCKRHPRKIVKLAFIWADGRACGFACSKQCFMDWEASQDTWACVVRVIPVNI